MRIKRRVYFGIGCLVVGIPIIAGMLAWAGNAFGILRASGLWTGGVVSLCLVLEGISLLVNGTTTGTITDAEKMTKAYLDESVEVL